MKKLLLVAILLSVTLGLSAPAFSGTYIADIFSASGKCGSVTVSGGTLIVTLDLSSTSPIDCSAGAAWTSVLVCGKGYISNPTITTLTDTNHDGKIAGIEGVKTGVVLPGTIFAYLSFRNGSGNCNADGDYRSGDVR